MKISTCRLTMLALLAAPFLCHGQATIGVVAGTGNPPINPGAIGDSGPARNAFLDGPDSVTLDAAGNLYIRERARVRKVTPAGIISTVAGNGTNGDSGDGGLATSAQLGVGPQKAGLATDSAGNLYIADSNNYRVRKVDTSGKITTVAGNGQLGLGSNGDGGQATNAALCSPTGVAVDRAGNLYIGSSICGGVRKVDPSGIITTVARNSAGPCYGVAVDDSGNLYINQGGVPSQIRKVSADGTITLIAGNGTAAYSGDGGPATSAGLFEVDGLAVDKAGNVFITDSGNGRIRKVDTAGIITTVAGHGTVGPGAGCQNLFTTGCPATNLKFGPSDVAVDSSGNLYTAGFIKGLVYKVSGVAGPPGTPSISANGVVNGASFIAEIAPSTWVSILGTNLSATTRSWKLSDFVGDDLPTVLDGVSVTIDGSPAYIYYISPTQLNVLTPDNLPSGPVHVQVTTAGVTSTSFTTTAGPVSPAFFLFTAKYPAAVHPSGVPVGKVGLIAGANFAPAKPGETILLFGTGFGATNPPLPAGKLVTKAEPLVNTVQVTIGGQSAHVAFAGVSGSGLDQLNVTIPPGLPDGDAAVLATIAGSTTQTNLFITVQH
jgi:uncharacterized protein (TIGR03437 family)